MTNDEVRGRFQGDDVEFHIADDVLVLSRNAVVLSRNAVADSTVLQSMLSTSGDRDQAEVHLSHEQSEHCRWWIAARARREGCADYILGPCQIGSGGEDNIACMIRAADYLDDSLLLHYLCGEYMAGVVSVSSPTDRQRRRWTEELSEMSGPLAARVVASCNLQRRERLWRVPHEVLLFEDWYAEAVAVVCHKRALPSGQVVEIDLPISSTPYPRSRRLGRRLYPPQRKREAVTALALSPCGGWFCTGRANGSVQVWNSATGEHCGTIQRAESSAGIRFLKWGGTHDLSLLATGYVSSVEMGRPDDAGKCGVWRLSNGSLFCELQDYSCKVHAVAWSPDGLHLCTACGDGLARLWRIRERLRLRGQGPSVVHCMQNHSSALTTVDWCSDGVHIATGGEDGRVTVWKTRKGRAGHLIAEVLCEVCDEQSDLAHVVTCVAWRPRVGVAGLPDGDLLAQGGCGQSLRLWDVPSSGARRARSLTDGDHVVQSVAWNPDGSLICTASGHLDWGSDEATGEATGDGVLRIWDVVTRSLKRTITVTTWPQGGTDVRVLAVAWSPCGKHIYAATDQPCVRIYNAT